MAELAEPLAGVRPDPFVEPLEAGSQLGPDPLRAAERPRAGDPLQVTFLGRSTVLLNLDGVRVLTDPSLPSRRRLPWSKRAPQAEPPRVDAVLVSHGHGRHMDVATLRRLPGSPRLVVPAGSASALRRAGLERIEEVRPGDVVSLGAIAVQAVGAAHGRIHGALDTAHEPLGYLVHGTSRVYFAGDSLPFEAMARLDEVDLALLPVAPTLRYVGRLSPAAAAETAAIVRPRVVVPIHWGGAGQLEEPAAPWMPTREQFTAERLESALRRAFDSLHVGAELRVVEPGYSTVIDARVVERRRAGISGAPIFPERRRIGLPVPGGVARRPRA